MPKSHDYDNYNVTVMMAKPLYLGIGINILIPAALAFICYWMDSNQKLTNPMFTGQMVDTLFMIFGIVTLIIIAVVIIKKQQLLKIKLIENNDLINEQIPEALTTKMKPLFLLTTLIALLGVIYYFLTASFKPTLFFIVVSFLVFQFLRPRVGFIHKLIDKQLE